MEDYVIRFYTENIRIQYKYDIQRFQIQNTLYERSTMGDSLTNQILHDHKEFIVHVIGGGRSINSFYMHSAVALCNHAQTIKYTNCALNDL